jgi:CheY-like chemotaxis protein
MMDLVGVWAGSNDAGDRRGARPDVGAAKSGDPVATRVLVVDDDPSILATVRDILLAEGYEVEAAGTGAQAISLVQTWRPALVLLDMRMPVMDGWAVARAIRALTSDLPIVVMTAAENAARWAEEIAADGYLAKPFQLDDLLRCVARFGREGRPQN